jgi:hypothetical protein
VRQDRAVSASRPAPALPEADPQPTTACPGCGAVLVAAPDDGRPHPGASPSCTRLFEVTLRGIREEAAADPAAAAAVELADAAYDAQHPDPADPERLGRALAALAGRLGGPVPEGTPAGRPQAWQMTVADVAADLDVVDLPALVGSWARTVLHDWR